MQGRRKTSNCHACVHKCHTEQQAIPDHRLKSIFLQLHQRKAIKEERERDREKAQRFTGPIQLAAEPKQQEVNVTIDRQQVISVQSRPIYICH